MMVQEGDPAVTPESIAEKEMELLSVFHQGFLDFLEKRGEDINYSIVANAQYEYEIAMASATDEQKDTLTKEFSSFRHKHSNEFAMTNLLRRIYVGVAQNIFVLNEPIDTEQVELIEGLHAEQIGLETDLEYIAAKIDGKPKLSRRELKALRKEERIKQFRILEIRQALGITANLASTK